MVANLHTIAYIIESESSQSVVSESDTEKATEVVAVTKTPETRFTTEIMMTDLEQESTTNVNDLLEGIQ